MSAWQTLEPQSVWEGGVTVSLRLGGRAGGGDEL